jgi:uncharacterized protein YjbI with pentapeptide repeats
MRIVIGARRRSGSRYSVVRNITALANPEHVEAFRNGVAALDAWRRSNPGARLDLSCADLSGSTLRQAKLREANFSRANLRDACLAGCNLVEATFLFADLAHADFSGANLGRASLLNADCTGAIMRATDFSGALLVGAVFVAADLTGADFHLANLSSADFTGADLTSANLMRTILTGVNVEGARLSRARIYGASVWSLLGTPLDQSELDIAPVGASSITVDHLQLAQFIFLLINNPEIREVIDAVTSKVVLILGRFSDSRKPVLDAVREELRRRNFVPVLFDFHKPTSKDFTGTVETLARMARFIIVDLTDPSSVPHELATIVPFLRTTPVLPLRLAGSSGYGMFRDLQAYPWVLPLHEYSDSHSLISELASVIAPAEKRSRELRLG